MPTAAKRACIEYGCPYYAVRYGRCDEHAKPVIRDRQRAPRAEAGRGWYFTKRWASIRRAVLAAEPLCRVCARRGQITAATDVDHLRAHRGDPALFWSRENLQPLCSGCHADKTARERHERAGGHEREAT